MIRHAALATAVSLLATACLTDSKPGLLEPDATDAGADAAPAPADGSGDGPAVADPGPPGDAPAPADVLPVPDVPLADVPAPPDAADVSLPDAPAPPDVPDPPDVATPDAEVSDGAPTPDVPPTEVCCLDSTDCPAGETCVNAHCLPTLDPPGCWQHADCDCGWADCDVEPTSWCEGALVLPNCAGNDATPQSGLCAPYPPPMAGPCCAEDADCPDGEICAKAPWAGITVGVCAQAPKPGRCWGDADCPGDEVCEGAAACPCNADCDMDYEGPGVCVVPGAICQSIEESWVQEWCDAASIVIFDGGACIQTCPGCCECKPFCDFTFDSIETCEAFCFGPPPVCAVFGGECDDAIPAKPWWYWDGTSCQEETSCMCEGCPGTFSSKTQCEGVCL